MLYTNTKLIVGGIILRIDEISKEGSIELEVKYNGNTASFFSEIVLVRENSVLITSIKVNEHTVGFSDKCTINFLYKFDGRLYIWENVSVKLVRYDGAIYHKVDMVGEGKPYNRRDSYRMYIGEDMPLYINSPSGPTAITVLVKDISETGVAFISKEDININRTIRLKLKDHNMLISLSGVIVRKEYLEHLDSFVYGCKFNEKNNRLGKYIARRQGEQLRMKTTTYSSPPKLDYSSKLNTIDISKKR